MAKQLLGLIRVFNFRISGNTTFIEVRMIYLEAFFYFTFLDKIGYGISFCF
jgi:hypothetical protein